MKKESILLQQTQPHDTDTEGAVLATLMRYNNKYSDYCDLLGAELFYYDLEKAIYRCIDGVINEGGITDINSLYNYAQSHDVGYKVERSDFLRIFQMASTQTLDQDIMRLRDFSRRRVSWMLMQQACQRMFDLMNDAGQVASDMVAAVNGVFSDEGRGDISSYGDGLDEVHDIIMENKEDKPHYMPTGIRLFDEYYLLRPYTLTVIAAFTSVGKSALAMNIAKAVAGQGTAVAYYSLEMSKAELVSRGISRAVGVPASVIMNRKLSDGQVRAFEAERERCRNLPIFFDDRSTADFGRTLRSIRVMVRTKGVRLAVIDYLQIFAQVTDDAEKDISAMARSAKNIAKELGIAVILISQLNRSALHPSIKMLRGSGQIEESADNIVLIDRPDAYPDNKVTKYEGEFRDVSVKGTAKLILAKGRGVGTGSRLMAFDGQFTEFREMKEPAEAGSYQDDQEDILPF